MEENLNDNNFLTPGPSPKERGASCDNIKISGYLTGNSQTARQLVQLAKNNRKEATEAEAILWQYLRNHKLGSKFRRQHPVGNYIPDFVCLEKKLIIEVDGGYHNTSEQIELDENRALELEEKYSFKVIRFVNDDVLKNIETVLTKIKSILSERKI